MHITVTGATGHIGIHVVAALLAEGYRVRALYRTPAHRAVLDGLEVESRQGDILDPAFLEEAFQGSDAVVHLAGLISIDGDPGGRVMRTNVEGARRVVEACLTAGVGRLVHFSSIDAVQYSKHQTKVDESTGMVGDDGFAYRVSKRRSEEEVWRGAEAGLPVIIFSPTAVIGPGDHYVSASGQMLRDLFRNRLPALVDAGFDWVDVRDIAGVVPAALRSGQINERYLLSGAWSSFAELSRLCRRISGRPTPRLTLPMWTAQLGLPFLYGHSRLTGRRPLYTAESLRILRDSNPHVSHAKAARNLGYAPRPLEQTLRDCYRWYVDQGFCS